MQRYANLPVKVFIETQLRPYSLNAQALNDLSMQYLSLKNFGSPVGAAETAITLISIIFDWGHYPSQLMAFCNQWRYKSGFDEIPRSENVERLAKILAGLLMEKPHPSTCKIYLKLLGLLRIAGVQDQQLLGYLINSVLQNMARHIQVDKLIYVFLIKCTLKISEGIRDYKYMIGLTCTKLIFALFSRTYLYTAPLKEMAKLYMDYLKLLVALGREVAMCPSWSQSDLDSVQHSNMMKSFCKVLVANLSITLDSQGHLKWLDLNQPQSKALLMDPRFQQQAYFEKPTYDLQIETFEQLPPTFPSIEPRQEEANHAHIFDPEIVEKVKSNSLSLLTMISRLNQELFLDEEMVGLLYPKGLTEYDIAPIYQSPLFAPFRILNSQFADVVQREYSNSGCEVHLAPLVKLSSEKQLSCHNFLKENYSKLQKSILGNGKYKPAFYSQMSLIGFFMTETNYELKSQIMTAVSIIHDQAYARLNASERAECTPARKHITVNHQFRIGDLADYGVKIALVYFLELFLTRTEHMGKILEGIHQCPIQSMLVHIPNKFVERVIHFLVVPVLAVCLHLHFDFYDQFDKFLTTIFEARFSEFFLARINCLRELLVHNFSLSRATRQSCEEYATKVKVLISAADELMEKFPHHMKREYRLFGEFAATEILTDKQLTNIHYFAPMMLSRIAGSQRDILTEASERFGLKSLTKEDIDLAKSKCFIPKYPDYEEHLRRSAEQLDLQDHQEFWPTIKTLFNKCVISGVHYGVKDKYEKYLISSLLMIGPPALELLDLELQGSHQITLENALLDIFGKLRNKKHQLLLIEHLLSSSVLEMTDLRKKLWAALFQMYKEKVLSVEIVFSNNMIITGLQDSKQLITTKEVTEIFKSCVGSLKSKNRKLINNCLKIFGTIMTHYPMNTIEWILNMQVPNCFSDEMPAENPVSAKTLRGGEFLNLVFQRFLEHKYSKYNVLTLSCLTNILRRHESSPSDPISGELVRIATCSQAGILLDKFCTSESFKFISLTIGYFLKDVCRGVLSQPQLQQLSLHCWTHVVCQEGQKDFSYLEQQGWQEIRYRAWLLLIKIQNSLCTTSETLQAFIHTVLLKNKKSLKLMLELEHKFLTETLLDGSTARVQFCSKNKILKVEMDHRDYQSADRFFQALAKVTEHVQPASSAEQIAVLRGLLSKLEERNLVLSRPLVQRSGDMTTRSNSPADRKPKRGPKAH